MNKGEAKTIWTAKRVSACKYSYAQQMRFDLNCTPQIRQRFLLGTIGRWLFGPFLVLSCTLFGGV